MLFEAVGQLVKKERLRGDIRTRYNEASWNAFGSPILAG